MFDTVHHVNCKSESKSLYNWWFTTNQFMASNTLRFTTTVIFFQLNPCSHNPYVTTFVMRGWISVMNVLCLFVKSMHCTYSMLLKILPSALYTSNLSVRALDSR
jgi:hypothetical protein